MISQNWPTYTSNALYNVFLNFNSVTRVVFSDIEIKKLTSQGLDFSTKETKKTIPKQITNILTKVGQNVRKNDENVGQNLPNVGQNLPNVGQNNSKKTQGFINNQNKAYAMGHNHTKTPEKQQPNVREIIEKEYGMKSLAEKSKEKPEPEIRERKPSVYKKTWCPTCDEMDDNEDFKKPTKKCANCGQFPPSEQGMKGTCPTCDHGIFEDLSAEEWEKLQNSADNGDTEDE